MARSRSERAPADPTDASVPTTHREVETTLEVPPGWTFPGPDDLLTAAVRHAGADAVAAPVVHQLQARYIDTADLLLARAKITLRRRTGGDDAGWHLKLPEDGDAARTEIRLPLRPGPQGPPRALTSLVLATTRTAKLEPVATLATTRRVHRVMGLLPPEPTDSPSPSDTSVTPAAVDASGTPAAELVVLAEIADDEVTATVGTEPPHTWRELEVELVEGSPGLLLRLVEALVAQGAEPSPHPSKLRRALGERLAQPATSPWASSPATASLPAARPKATAGEVLRVHVAAQRDALLAGDAVLRRRQAGDGRSTASDEAATLDAIHDPAHEAVHRMRVATRRLRSALATARPMLVTDVTEPLRAEAQWAAGQLGAARDAHVLRGHLLALLRAQRPGSLPETVRARVAARADAGVLDGLTEARAVLDTPRYLHLLDALDAFVADPPFTEAADQSAATVLRARARRDFRRLADAVEAADGARDPAEHAEALHEVRKAAKRARYGAEVLVPVVGKDAARYARAVEAVQEALGQVQDSVVLRQLLREVATQALADGEDTFDLGRLHAFQEVQAVEGEDAFEQAWEDVAHKRLRRWM